MKYFKFTQIDAETGISWAINQPISGPSWPDIPGLDMSSSIQLDYFYYVTKGDDSVVANPSNHLFELTLEEYANEIRSIIINRINEIKATIYKEELEYRNSVFNIYHDTASLAGIYKYEQARELVANETAAAPDVRAEASARGVTPLVMANRIIQNHENFRAKESKIAGIRGKILDRIESFNFNMSDPDASYLEFFTEEVIGTTTEKVYEDGELVDIPKDVKVNKFSLNLPLRMQYE